MGNRKRQAGNNDDKIEITPEMIEAGRMAWANYDPRFDSQDALICRVFAAMLKTSKRGVRAKEENWL